MGIEFGLSSWVVVFFGVDLNPDRLYRIYFNFDLTVGLASKKYPKLTYYLSKSINWIKSYNLQTLPSLAFEYGPAIYQLYYLLYVSARHISLLATF